MIPDYAKSILAADAQAYIKRLMGWPYAGVAIEADRWAERKYLFAREIWCKRAAACPGFAPMSWAERFEQMFGEPLENYGERLRAVRPKEAA